MPATQDDETSSSPKSENKPRNHVITDASKPFVFTYRQYGKSESIVVHQTTAEETWPGGSLWDIGVLLSHVLVGLAGYQSISASAANTTNKTTASTATTTFNNLPPRILQAIPSTKDLTVLELGCGVGLTGIVAAAALGTQLTILTDLKPVVDQVALPNVIRNSTGPPSGGKQQISHRFTQAGKRGKIIAMPLCWGDPDDEKAVAEVFEKCIKPQPQPKRKKKQDPQLPPKDHTKPDMIIIGDVAYQHKPGAPSHFDALVSTLLKFLGPQTLVIFGTRMRMPASKDLLLMFSEHMEEIVSPPVAADEIDPSFGKFKHHITVHVFRKRPET